MTPYHYSSRSDSTAKSTGATDGFVRQDDGWDSFRNADKLVEAYARLGIAFKPFSHYQAPKAVRLPALDGINYVTDKFVDTVVPEKIHIKRT